MERDRGVLIVDAANVIGSRPDGWWRDRAGAAERLVARLGAAMDHGNDSDLTGRRVVVVLEGRAREAAPPRREGLEIVRAAQDGDQTIVDLAAQQEGSDVVVVTSDRELQRRVAALGAQVRGAGWLLALLDDPPTGEERGARQ